jgi:hypothetical protein
MERFGLLQKILKLVQETYRNYTSQIIQEGKLSDSIEIKSGVRQGCVLSPIVLLLVTDEVLRKILRERKEVQYGQ